jgi:methylenetetrahydrofolate dehydrogenase (NADP+)/methenyltetrahydrofolate cyclohydrolase
MRPEGERLATIIDGKRLAADIRADLAVRIRERAERGLRRPGLVTILVGDDPASRVYVARKQRESSEIGMHSESVELPSSVGMKVLVETIRDYNERRDIDGILVQMPLPVPLDGDAVISAVDPAKDVDGLHPLNQGALFTGRFGIRPCTPISCMYLLDKTGVDPHGKHAVVVGRSVLVGRPVAMLLLERDATVVLCHSRTSDLPVQVRAADIVIAACGNPELVRGDWIKPGAVVIDVGINRVGGKLIGDVEFATAEKRAGFITPVPGGVGPMTVAMLLRNTFDACCLRDGDARVA